MRAMSGIRSTAASSVESSLAPYRRRSPDPVVLQLPVQRALAHTQQLRRRDLVPTGLFDRPQQRPFLVVVEAERLRLRPRPRTTGLIHERTRTQFDDVPVPNRMRAVHPAAVTAPRR